MRLIDADELIETLNKDIESIKDIPDSLAKEIAIKAAEFFIQDIQDINTTPTAYDIDKVVEEITKLRNDAYSDTFKYDDGFYDGQTDGLEKALDIINKHFK